MLNSGRKGFKLALMLVSLILSLPLPIARALDSNIYQQLQGPFYDAGSPNATLCTGSSISISGNKDYAGRNILSAGNLKSVGSNTSFYQQAAKAADIPWPVLAAIHYREHGFSRQEPASNSADGVYQITDANSKTAGAYPDGGVNLTDDQFAQQSLDAAKFVKNKLPSLTASTSEQAAIKQVLGLYNGLPGLYADQAARFGFSRDQAYEGSPYVMNFADARRDPNVAPSGTWQQYGTGPGGAIGDAGDQYGAFLIYADLSGATVTGGCASTNSTCNSDGQSATEGLSVMRQNAVCLALQEYAKWQDGTLKPGSGYLTYSQNRHENWCADFASWIYNQAQYPLKSPQWNVSYVPNIQAIGQKNANFHWHTVAGYTPRPGDLVIHGADHVNMVVGVSGKQMTLIGGNQGERGFDNSSVTEYKTDFSDAGSATGFVTPD